MNTGKMKTMVATLIAFASLFFGSKYFDVDQGITSSGTAGAVETLFEQRHSGQMVQFDGRIVKQLADDNKGSRHQRFIVAVNGQLTVLIAHNIDLAPRVPINGNTQVSIYGQYEWNDRGGVIHWTHHDPQGQHADGWIKYQGKTYQ